MTTVEANGQSIVQPQKQYFMGPKALKLFTVSGYWTENWAITYGLAVWVQSHGEMHAKLAHFFDN